jgi:hypothetical protein
MSTFIKAGFWEKLCKPCKGYKGWLNLDEFITNIVTALIPPVPESTYKVYTALLTQSGGDNQQANDNETQYPFVIGVSYYIEENTNQNTNNSADFTNIGALNNDVGTHFIATGTTPNSWGNGGYVNLTYNLGAPVVTVLENTIGNVWFTYLSTGVYLLNSDSLFTDNKTFINGANFAQPVFNRMINEGGEGFSAQKGYFFLKYDESEIRLKTLEDAEVFADSIIVNPICIEIRVYN